ncbi:MAG TPA: hypothetical protein DDY70_05995 [Clostridiales bacterium]|nr:hypothetical protein [Clostridiales bacterium]
MKKLLLFILLISCFSLLYSCKKETTPVAGDASRGGVYLICGFDDAAENTDVLILFGYDAAENMTTAVQIPRDTYFASGTPQNKINQLYATYRAAGHTEEESLVLLKRELAALLGIRIDGAVGLGTSALRKSVDLIGGVTLRVPTDLVTKTADGESTVLLTAGEHTLDGKAAETFVRYREGYALGDVGRVDAQKLFLSAFFKKAKESIGMDTLLGLLRVMREEVVTDISFTDATGLLIKNFTKFKDTGMRYVTLPGQSAVGTRGLWYYAANLSGTREVARRYLFSDGLVDPAGRLTDPDEIAIDNIYHDDGLSYRVFGEGELADLSIAKK